MPLRKTSVLRGAAAGTALAIAAGLLLASPRGRRIARNARKGAGDFYAYIAPRLQKMRELGKKEYAMFIAEALDRFAELRRLSEEELEEIKEQTRDTWKQMKRGAPPPKRTSRRRRRTESRT